MDIEKMQNQIVDLTLEQYHKPYIHGGHGPDTFDCAGLAWYVYNEILGIDIYKDGYGKSTTTMIMTSSYGKIQLFEEEIKKLDLNDFKLGDILLFHRQSLKYDHPTVTNRYPGHCGIYVGNGDFIHAVKSHGKVIFDILENEMWNKKLIGKKDIFADSKILKK